MAIQVDSRFAHEHIREFEDGELIFAEGDTNRDLFVIQEGKVEIRKKSPMGELTITRFEKGEFFGDMALLQGIPRFASAHSIGKSRLLVLQPGGFLLKIRRDPTFAFEMLQQLSLRVKLSTETFLGAVAAAGLPAETVQKILNSVEKGPR